MRKLIQGWDNLLTIANTSNPKNFFFFLVTECCSVTQAGMQWLSELTAALDSWAQMILLPWLPKVLGLQPRATTPSQGQRFHKGKARIFLTTATKRLIWRCSLSEILQMMCSVTQWNQQNKPGCRVLVWKEGGWAL